MYFSIKSTSSLNFSSTELLESFFAILIYSTSLFFDNVLSIGVKRDNYSSDLSIDEMNDITETALDGYNDFDYVIYNDNIDSLKSDTFKLFEDIKMR